MAVQKTSARNLSTLRHIVGSLCKTGLCCSALVWLLALFAPQAAAQAPVTTFPGQTAVGSPAPPVSLSLIFQHPGQTAAPVATTAGVTGLDFTIADAGTCGANQMVAAGQTCTLQAGFAPRFPGMRLGAVQVLSSDGKTVLAAATLSGVGLGSLPVLVPGEMTTIAGDNQWIYHGDGGLATNSPIFLPNGLAVDGAGNLFLSDSNNNRVRRVDALTGVISTVAGDGTAGFSGDGGPAIQAEVSGPAGLVLDGAGNLYFADSANNVIRRVDATTGLISTVAGMPGSTGFSPQSGTATQMTLSDPQGLALTATGDLLIADSGNAAVRLLTFGNGQLSTVAGTGAQGYNGDQIAATTAQLNQPWGVAARSDGAFAIADLSNHRVRLVSNGGLISTVAGTGSRGFSGDSDQATSAQLNNPADVAFDPAGDLLIADAGNNRVRGVYGSSPGIITTLTGNDSEEFAGDGGPANQASLYGPYKVLFDATGNVWISDMFHNRVREIHGSQLNLPYNPMRVGKTSAPMPEMLYNAGNHSLTLGNPVLTQAALDPATTTCNTNAMDPTVFCTMGVEFAPTTVGSNVNGSIQWPSDAPNILPTDNLSGQVLSVEPTSVAVVANANPGLAGSPVTLTAAVTSADTGRTGTVTFSEGSQVWCNAVALGTDGTAACTIPGLSLGTHSFTAAYSGDDNNAASTSPAYSETIKQQPALALAASPAQAVVTGTVTLTFSAADANGVPSGNVVFYNGATALTAVVLDSNGAATYRTSSLGIGTHQLSAQYSGDSSNVSGTSNVVSETVVPANTATTLMVSNASPTVGSSITLSASVTSNGGPSPTGTVNFTDGSGAAGVSLGSGILSASGTASLSLASLTPGSHSISAVYGGDADNLQSTSPASTVTVQQVATVTAISTDANPANAGQILHILAAVALAPGTTAEGPLTGSVAFQDGSTQLGTATLDGTGQASFATSSLTVATHALTAIYFGNTNYATSTSPTLHQVVQATPTSTALVSNAPSVLAGKPVTLQASVTSTTSTPGGTVVFRDGEVQLGSATLDGNGTATFTTTALAAGTHNLVASYGGNANFLGSNSAVAAETVERAQPVLVLTGPGAPVDAGTAAQLTATVTSPGVPPTGMLQLLDGNTVVASVTLGSGTSYSLSPGVLALGGHTLTLAYAGDLDNASATSAAVILNVQQAPTATTLASSANPLTQGSSLTLSAAVSSGSPNATGQVTFFNDAVSLGTANLNGNGAASLSVATPLTLGQHSLTAVYSGDALHAASTSGSLPELVVQPVAASLSSSNNPSTDGQNVVFTATFHGAGVAVSGTATFSDNGALLATVPLSASGSATYTTAALAVGTHAISVQYSGDPHYAVAEAQLSQTVVSATTQTTLSSSSNPALYGQPLTLTATVASNGGAATGTVAFRDGGQTIGTAQVSPDQPAVFTISTLSPGTHTLTAQYLGNGADTASGSAPLALSVKQATNLVLSSSSNPSLTLSPITLSVTLSDAGAAVATGPVTFYDGNAVLGTGTLDAAGHASFTAPKLAAGAHTLTAAYAGDAADLPSTAAPLGETVQLRSTAITVTGSATDAANPQQVTLIAVVKSSGPAPPGGTVTFTIGSLTLGVAPVDATGVATLTVIFETATQQVQAAYGGDASYAASQSAATPITAGQAPQFTLALDASQLTLVTKQHQSLHLTLASVKGFSDLINLGCEGLPYAATCSFTNTQLKLASNGSAATTLVVDTGNPLGAGSAGTAALQPSPARVWFCCTPAGLLLLLLCRKGRHTLRGRLGHLLLLLLTLTLAGAATGCGGLSISGTPPGTYTFKVVATGQGSGATQDITVTLAVTQ